VASDGLRGVPDSPGETGFNLRCCRRQPAALFLLSKLSAGDCGDRLKAARRLTRLESPDQA
jgi:hypothetical protein